MKGSAAIALPLACVVYVGAASAQPSQTPEASPAIPVDVGTFVRAETDMYFAKTVQRGAFGKFVHDRAVVAIDKQDVVGMNRDTLYSYAVFDLDAAPVTITLPDTGKRFMSLLAISQDHYVVDLVYAPGRSTYTRETVGTRYIFFPVRTLMDPRNAADVKAANALQDAIQAKQANIGTFEVPNWDSATRDRARSALLALNALGGSPNRFGRKDEVNPIHHLIGTAAGWGGNPPSAAIYVPVYPKANDGKTVHQIRVKDVPVDGFWSISVYNAERYFEKNALNAYSVNNLTGTAAADGSYTVQFGGCDKRTPNCLPIMPGWNYILRLYRPRAEIQNGSWAFPAAQPVQ
jgi:para-nitrobenzyl esterase